MENKPLQNFATVPDILSEVATFEYVHAGHPVLNHQGRLSATRALQQCRYNWVRLHSAHHGKTPMERYFELAEQTPYFDVVRTNYQPSEEHIQEQNYKLELELRKWKRCL